MEWGRRVVIRPTSASGIAGDLVFAHNFSRSSCRTVFKSATNSLDRMSVVGPSSPPGRGAPRSSKNVHARSGCGSDSTSRRSARIFGMRRGIDRRLSLDRPFHAKQVQAAGESIGRSRNHNGSALNNANFRAISPTV